MQFINLTRANEIGANCYHVTMEGRGFLLDCGSHPKFEGYEGVPRLNLLKGRPLHAAFITHAHLDHIGNLPLVMEDHPDARVYLTQATSLLTERALHNSASVMMRQRTELDLPEYPLYTHRQLERLTPEFELAPYEREFQVNGVDVTFFEAGHLMGAAGIRLKGKNGTLFYTGDAKFSDMRITRAARFPEESPDVLVMECTRGSTPSQPDFAWEGEIQRLTQSILETFERGGSVLIPCFALGKMQEVLKMFHDLMQKNVLPRRTIFLSGLGQAYNEIYDELAHHHPRVCPGFKITKSLDLAVLDQKEIRGMEPGPGRIFLLSSGMMTPHTLSHLMASRMAGNPKNAIFFVGYVDPETPGGKIKAAGQGGVVDMGGHIGQLDIRCPVKSFDLTSHCNREHMLDYVVKVRPKNAVLVHGETTSLEWFKEQIQQKIPECRVIIPPSGEEVTIG